MEWFTYQQSPASKSATEPKELFAEQVPVKHLAQTYGTPVYIYSRQALEAGFQAYHQVMAQWPHLICYAVKANSNLAVLNVLARLGAGFDIVSVGELERVLAAGGDPKKVVFSGVAKQAHEIRRALEVGVHCFNIESEQELEGIQQEAQNMNIRARISLRVNPDVDARTHPYISTGLKDNKFGIDINKAYDVYYRASQMNHIEIVGVDCHIGSQLTTIEPFLDALERLLLLMDQLKAQGIHLRHLDIGGGLGIQYDQEVAPTPGDYLGTVKQRLVERGYGDVTLLVEPGRSIAAQAGIMLTRVELLKSTTEKHFAIVDGAMNDLLRPAIYSAWHTITNTVERPEAGLLMYDIVGPVCESGDFLGKERALALCEGDLLAVHSAGAYGFVMSSNYNTRCRAAEVMVDGTKAYEVRRRETIAELLEPESLIP